MENRVVFSGASPFAVNDLVNAVADQTLEVSAFSVLANDTDAEGDTLLAKEFLGPKNGSLTLNEDGTFAYTPDPGFSGVDGFVYQVDDGTSQSALAAVTINVVKPNSVPEGVNDEYQVDEDGVLEVLLENGVLANDEDSDGDMLTAELDSGPAHGTLVLNSDGSFNYTPDENFSGSDSFTYRTSDGESQSELVVVELTVTQVNDVPSAMGESFATGEDIALSIASIDLLQNDSDPDGDPLSVLLEQGPRHGTLDINPDGSFTYTPDSNYHGVDSFSYRVSDGIEHSELVEATVTVTSSNDAPVAVNDLLELAEDSSVSFDLSSLLANDTDVDGDTLLGQLVSDPMHGTLNLLGDGSFEYVPDANFSGTDAFTYMVSDGITASELAVVEIVVNAVNDAPMAVADTYETNQDQTLAITADGAAVGLLVNDSDIEGDELSTTVEAQPEHGSVTIQADGSFVYVPEPGYVGVDQFSYSVTDGNDSSVATVTVNVLPVADLVPQAANDSYSALAGETLSVDAASGVLANDAPQGNSLQAVLFRGPTHGELILNEDGSFDYTAEVGYTGIDSFIYRASNADAQSRLAVVTIHVATPQVETSDPGEGEPSGDGSDTSSGDTTASEDSGATGDTENIPQNSNPIEHGRRRFLSSHRHHEGRSMADRVDRVFGSINLGDLFRFDFDCFF